MMKNPTIATVLNLIPGLGYVYIGGRKRIFGSLLLLSLALAIVASFDPLLAVSPDDPYLQTGFRLWDVATNLAVFVPIGALMYDAYASTVEHNQLRRSLSEVY